MNENKLIEEAYHPEKNVLHWGTDILSLLITENTHSDIGHTMNQHLHQYYEILLNFSAIPLQHTVGGQSYVTDSPCIIFRSPYILHRTITLDSSVYTRCNIGFHPQVLHEFSGVCDLGNLKNCLEIMIPVTADQLDALIPLLNRLKQIRNPAVPKGVGVCTLALLLYEINTLASHAAPHKIEVPSYMQSLLQYLNDHIEEKMNIDDLAERYYVSRSTLIRTFRKTTNMSLHTYIIQLRINKAKILLETQLPMSIIAEKCGFASDSSFSTMFRRYTGISPSRYRSDSHAIQNHRK